MSKETELPKVSVIIPAYNSALTINDSIKSVLSQSYNNIEIIIVNDGSNDETSRIAHEVENDNKAVKVIDQENRGLGEARNSGMAVATGSYVIYLDSDDMLLPWSIEDMISVAEKRDADIVVGKLLETSRPIEKYNSLVKEGSRKTKSRALEDGYKSLLYMKIQPSAHAKLYRASLIKNELFSKIRHAEDLEFNLRIFKKAKNICILDSPIVEIYALTSGSMMRSAYNDKKHEELEILRDLGKKYSDCRDKGLKKAYAASIFFHSVGLARTIYGDKEAIRKYSDDYEEYKKYIKKYSRTVLLDKNALASQRKYAAAATVSVNAMLRMMQKAAEKS